MCRPIFWFPTHPLKSKFRSHLSREKQNCSLYLLPSFTNRCRIYGSRSLTSIDQSFRIVGQQTWIISYLSTISSKFCLSLKKGWYSFSKNRGLLWLKRGSKSVTTGVCSHRNAFLISSISRLAMFVSYWTPYESERVTLPPLRPGSCRDAVLISTMLSPALNQQPSDQWAISNRLTIDII